MTSNIRNLPIGKWPAGFRQYLKLNPLRAPGRRPHGVTKSQCRKRVLI